MDALIRLDVPLPFSPTTNGGTEISSSPVESTSLNLNQTTDTGPVKNTNFIDLTIPLSTTVDTLPLCPLDLSPKKDHNPAEDVSFLQPSNSGKTNGHSNEGHISTLGKHKLLLLETEDNYSPNPPKLCKKENYLSLANATSSHHMNHTFVPNTISFDDESSPVNLPSVIMKNHTVTSLDELPPGKSVLSSPKTSIKMNPDWSFAQQQQQNYQDNVGLLSQTTQHNANECQTAVSIPTSSFAPSEIKGKNTLINNTLLKSPATATESYFNNEKETKIFYQLLDIFPDIDLKFLKNQCFLGMDVNMVSEIILGMNDYPKEKYCYKPIGTPNNFGSVKSQTPLSSSNSSSISDTPDLILDYEFIRAPLPEYCKSSAANDELVFTSANGQPSDNIDQEQTSIVRSLSSSLSLTVKEEEVVDVEKEQAPNKPLVMANNELPCKVNNSDSIENKFNFLIEIFPDADPKFIETQSKLNENDLRNFIAKQMEAPDYPKLITSIETVDLNNPKTDQKIDNSDEISLYTSNFNLEEFLKIFPDPCGYFLDDKRNCTWSSHGVEFLKNRYRCHAVNTILQKYKNFNNNLVKTCECLDGLKATRLTKRSLAEIRMPVNTNLPFLQEACFIEHKHLIMEHLNRIAEEKKHRYELAEARGELIECGCCYQNVYFEECTTCDEGHLFCKECVKKSVEVRIGDGHTTFPCLQDCGSAFSLRTLEELVDATLFSRLLQRIQLDEVRAADIEGLEVCPFCDFAIILPPETNIFKCLNPHCLRESCRKCHRLSHIPQRCEELENDDQERARKYIEDEMTRALIRVCYKCQKSFIKIDGCNKMTCSCGAKMCYICRKPITDYNHFNGPGGDKKERCPLYSTEKLLHVDAVAAVAKKALDEVTSKNPQLKLKYDPTKILPSAASAKTNLPPGVNEEADRLINVLHNMRNYQVQVGNENYHVQVGNVRH